MTRRTLLTTLAALGFGGGAARTVGADSKAAKPAPVASAKLNLSDAEWKARLTAEQYHVLRQEGTEPPGTSALNREKRKGTYHCAGCELPLFSSATKYESGTGWPSFYQPSARRGRTQDRLQIDFSAHRVSLRAMRRPSGPCVRRRPARRRASATAITAWRSNLCRRQHERAALLVALLDRCRIAAGAAFAQIKAREAGSAGQPSRIDRDRHVCRRMLLVHRGRLRQSRRRDLDDVGLHRRQDRQSHLRQRVGRQQRARGSGAGGLRPEQGDVLQAARVLLAHDRSDDQGSAVLRLRQPLPNRDLHARRTAAGVGGSVEKSAEQQQAVSRADRDRDRQRNTVLSGRGLSPGLLQEKSGALQVLSRQLRTRRAPEATVGRTGGSNSAAF